MTRFRFLTLLLPSAVAFSAFPHQEEIAPGVHAAGFAAKYGSANCGWAVLGNTVLMVDLPSTISAADHLREVRAATGKKDIRLILTGASPKPELVREVSGLGIQVIPATEPRLELPFGATLFRFAGLGQAVWIPRAGVLFAGPAVVNGPPARLAGLDTGAWIAALKTLEQVPARHVVPGFGSWGAPAIVTRQRRYLAELRRQVGYLVAQDRPRAQIPDEIQIGAEYQVWMSYDNPSREDIDHVYGELTAPFAPFGNNPPGRGGAPHALVLIGDGPHEPGHLEEGLRPVFEATGVTPHFTVDVKTLNAANLARVPLLVILRDGWMRPNRGDRTGVPWMTPEQEKAVVEFVQAGGSFLNLHNSMGLYPDGGPYLNLVGGRYIGHGPLERFRVEVVDREHPITRGVTAFFAADEQHTPPYDEKKVRLLLRNVSEDGKTTAAAGWAYEPGKGRLAHLASGHTRDALNHPMHQRLMRNAVLWLLRKPVP